MTITFMTVSLFLLFYFLPVGLAARNSKQSPPLLPVERANYTLQGLLEYYWMTDPVYKQIQFFFACGQIGGGGSPYVWNKCSCYSTKSCIDCYRWWDAVALESIATFGVYTDSKDYSTIPEVVFRHSPYNSKWDATSTYYCTFVDDFAWYGIAYLRIYEWLKAPVWLERTTSLFEWLWKYGWDQTCGGFWWNLCDTQHYKDSITIVEMMHLTSKLAYLFPKNDTYLLKAEKVWNWFFSFDDGYGLMSDKYLVSTGAIPEKCCNSSSKDPLTKCYNSKISGTSYNQGLLMSSAAYLYRRTGNKTYLLVGMRSLEAILTNYTTDEGILIDEPRSYQTYNNEQCWGGISDPGGDYYSFQGIFMLHLSYFIDLLRENSSLPDDTLERVKSFVSKTSDAAWTRSAVWAPFTEEDVCNTNPKKLTSKYPKFHWWWGMNNTEQIIPPSPRIFFHKMELRCYTLVNNSQLWQGEVIDEGTCMVKCLYNKTCAKYLFQTYEDKVQGLNCWLWTYNRTDHICNKSDSDFTAGFKRPVGASCAGHCNNSTPINTSNGGVCYCDSQCPKHLDCCLDYADLCLPQDTVPSCKGQCSQNVSQPIRGGGYCWCMDGCLGYTDNNSDGSCCPDYHKNCLNITMPTCLDARSQGSAFNLFIAHLKLSKIN